MFGFLKKKKFSLDDFEGDTKENREHYRYELSGLSKLKVFSLSLKGFGSSEKQYGLGTLSYGGMDFADPPKELESIARTETIIEGTVSVFGKATSFTGHCVHYSPNKVGIQFVHENPLLLIFLRSPIESLRVGNSMLEIEKSHLKERFKDPQWTCLRGGSPTDLNFHIDQSSHTIDEFILTFRDMERYLSIEMKDDHVATAVNLDREGIGARMARTQELDQSILRQGLQILSGINNKSFCQFKENLIASLVEKL